MTLSTIIKILDPPIVLPPVVPSEHSSSCLTISIPGSPLSSDHSEKTAKVVPCK